jgi:hypothetical protein
MNKYQATPKRHAALIRGTAFVMLFLTCVFATAFVATQLDLTTQVKGILPIANGGTNSGTATGSGSVVLATSPTLTTPSFSGDIGSNLGLGSSSLLTTITNDTVTGTTANLLTKLSSSAPSKVIITGTGDTSGIVGVCLVNCGTSGSAGVAIHGQAGCTADNSITAGDYIVEGTTTAGRCKSVGAAPVTSNQIIGRSLTTTSAAATATIMLFGQDIPDTAAGVNFADDETPSGTINGSNVTFTLAHSPSPVGSLALFKNGQKLEPGGADYTLSGATITMVAAPKTGDILTTATYRF